MICKHGIIVLTITLIMIIMTYAIFLCKPVINDVSITANLQGHSRDYLLSEQISVYKEELNKNYQATTEALDKKFNGIISILGIAVMVWVALNISNTLDRRELDKLRAETNDLINEMKNRYEESMVAMEVTTKALTQAYKEIAKYNHKAEEDKKTSDGNDTKK